MNALDRARLEAVTHRLDAIEDTLSGIADHERRLAELMRTLVELATEDRRPAPSGPPRLHLVRDE